jgi:polysaccharide export outer membrane protein
VLQKEISMSNTMKIIASTLLSFSLATCVFAQKEPAKKPADTPVKDTAAQGLAVHDGDLLEVSVSGAPEYHYEVRVSPSGEITLPMAGKIAVGGLSTAQAEAALNQRLQERGIFNDPQSSIFVKDYATEGISVLGEVQKPGIYPLMGKRTLFDAISAASGTTEKAGKTVTITHRDHPDAPQTVALNYDESDRGVSNVPVQSGDTVVISKAGMVYVVGDVKDPTGIIMENSHMTVLQAIALAHGANPTAKLGAAKLIRNSPTGTKEIPIPLDKILSTKSPDLQLYADDVLFVPNSAAKSATRRGLEAMVQAATGVAIYRHP